MTKLVYSAGMSLDGFIAGPGGDMQWMSDLETTATSAELEDVVANVGALLIGKRTFTGDDPNKGTDAEGAFGGTWQGPSIVLTHEPPADASDPDVTYCDDLATAVETAKRAAGDKDVHVLGANVAKQCLDAGLLDELLIFMAPVLLGDGTRLFDHPGGTQVRLERLNADSVSSLWYRVVR